MGTDVSSAIDKLARIERIALELEQVGLAVSIEVAVDVRIVITDALTDGSS